MREVQPSAADIARISAELASQFERGEVKFFVPISADHDADLVNLTEVAGAKHYVIMTGAELDM